MANPDDALEVLENQVAALGAPFVSVRSLANGQQQAVEHGLGVVPAHVVLIPQATGFMPSQLVESQAADNSYVYVTGDTNSSYVVLAFR